MKNFTKFWKLLICVCLVANIADAQTAFQKIIGDLNYDIGNSVQQTFDGGYIVGGSSISDSTLSYSNCYLIKTDEYGDPEWIKILNAGLEDGISSVRQTGDSGFIMTGRTSGNYNQFNWDVLVIKTDVNGNVQWSKYIGDSLGQVGEAIIETSDHGFILCGYTFLSGGNPDGSIVIKLDSAGNIIWTYKFDSSQIAYDIQETPSGDFVIGGNYLNGNLFIMKVDGAGSLLMNRSFESFGESPASSLIQTGDGGFALFGTGSSSGLVDYDFFLIRIDSLGNLLWASSYGGPYDEFGYSAKQKSDGGFVLSGKSQSIGGSVNSACVIMTDSAGNGMWMKGISGGDNEEFYSIATANDGGFILTGVSNSFANRGWDLFLVKTDSLLQSGCNDFNISNFTQRNFTLSAQDHTQSSPLSYTSNDLIYTSGTGGSTIALCGVLNISSTNQGERMLLYPNPSFGLISLQFPDNFSTGNLQIVNSIGELVYVSTFTSETSKEIELKNLSSGIYFVIVNSGGEVWREKIVLEGF